MQNLAQQGGLISASNAARPPLVRPSGPTINMRSLTVPASDLMRALESMAQDCGGRPPLARINSGMPWLPPETIE